jgi:hypothetical protein
MCDDHGKVLTEVEFSSSVHSAGEGKEAHHLLQARPGK